MKFEGQLQGHEVSARPARTDVTYDVWVSCDAGEFEAQIVNLSAMGFRLRCEAACRGRLERQPEGCKTAAGEGRHLLGPRRRVRRRVCRVR